MAEPKLCEPNPQAGHSSGCNRVGKHPKKSNPLLSKPIEPQRDEGAALPHHPAATQQTLEGNHPLFGPYWCCAWQ